LPNESRHGDAPILNGDTTLDEHSREGAAAWTQPESLALVIAYAAGEPWRVGAVALLPGGSPGASSLLGRGPAVESDTEPRLAFGQQRPGGIEELAALTSPTISRVQLRLRTEGGRLDVENVGRCRLLHNGVESQRAQVVPGDTLQLGRSLLLLCVRRIESMPRPADEYRSHAFGEPDAHGIVGESPVIWRVRQQLAYVATRPGHVLLLGASGTGKELAARAIHRISAAGTHKLVARNAATIPDSIADAELFGNAKNYPNPGMVQRNGLVGEANGSTLFLDEFAELSAPVQARLLRVLDEGEYQPLGDACARRSTFRLVAASNRSESTLKPDLLARLRFRIELPDLSARLEDIPLLVRHLLSKSGSLRPATARPDPSSASSVRPEDDADAPISCELIAECLRRPFATNVRELESWLAEKVSAAAGQGPILGRASVPSRSPTASTLPPEAAPERDQPGASSSDADEGGELGAAEIQAMLDRHNGVIEATWRALGLKNRHALARLIAKHGIEIRKRPGR